MLVYLWIVGILAIVWPLIVANKLDHETRRKIEHVSSLSIDYYSSSLEKKAKELQSEIDELKEKLRHQDELVAVLWAEVIGWEHREWTKDGSWAWANHEPLAERRGVRPKWHIDPTGELKRGLR